MRFDVITLFPELFEPFLRSGVTRRAFGSGEVEVHLHQLRDYAQGPYRRVDDRPFGGGPGMVMLPEPLYACVEAVRAQREPQTPLVLFTPVGQRFEHAQVQQWAQGQGAVLVCGRYEGVDQRFIDRYVTHQLSLGDFVLSGGEIPAMALLDAVARLMPGVLGDEQSSVQDSFHPSLQGMLDCPHYTRPEVWQGQAVPAVLLSGDHARIQRWRAEQSLHLTTQLRPDLLARSAQPAVAATQPRPMPGSTGA